MTTETKIEPDLYQPDVARIRVRLVGDTVLVANAWSDDAIAEIRNKQLGGARGKKKPKDPEKCFDGARYRLDDGTDAFPKRAIKKAMIAAAAKMEIQKNTISQCVRVSPGEELLPIVSDPPVMREDMVRVGSKGPGTGTADLRYRPEYRNWSITADIYFERDLVTVDQVVELLKQAGRRIGLGNDRPELNNGGEWGMFHVEPVADEKAA